MSGLCVECWHGLDCIVKQTLCRVSDTSTVQDVFDLSVVPKLDRELQMLCRSRFRDKQSITHRQGRLERYRYDDVALGLSEDQGR